MRLAAEQPWKVALGASPGNPANHTMGAAEQRRRTTIRRIDPCQRAMSPCDCRVLRFL